MAEKRINAAVNAAIEKKERFAPMSSAMHQKAILANTSAGFETPGPAHWGLFITARFQRYLAASF